MFNIGDKLTEENYTEGAIWCNENGATIELIDGEYVIVAIPEPLPPTYEEVRQIRENLYREKKDPITCQIQSLRDEEQTDEVIAEIESLKIKRAEIVTEIKEANPYPA
jgi:hypothetical protein